MSPDQPTVSIRAFAREDEPHVIALWSDVFRDDPPWNAPAHMIRRKLTVQPELFFVAERDACVIGTVLAGFDGVRGWIYHLCVQPNQRRAGVGRQLMRAAERALAALDCPKINLQVRAANAQVIAFYEALGYALEERASLGKRIAP